MPARNNIGLLRLLFAGLVIVGHAPELLDGDRTREPLTVLFHTLSLGELAVDAFFLLSGFLITRSFQNASSIRDYLLRRILRIYPAFVVAYLACIFVLAPATGGRCWNDPGDALFRLVSLQPPGYCPGQLAGIRHHGDLNGAMWTIAYEFRCYVLTAILGVCGLLGSRKTLLALTAIILALGIMTSYPPILIPLYGFLVHVEQLPLLQSFGVWLIPTIRLTGIYLAGTCCGLFWREIEPWLNGKTAAVCGGGALALLYDPYFAEAGLATFGAGTVLGGPESAARTMAADQRPVGYQLRRPPLRLAGRHVHLLASPGHVALAAGAAHPRDRRPARRGELVGTRTPCEAPAAGPPARGTAGPHLNAART